MNSGGGAYVDSGGGTPPGSRRTWSSGGGAPPGSHPNQKPTLGNARRVSGDGVAARGHLRQLGLALAVAAVALPGALPGSRGEPDAVAFLVWLALVAPAAGAVAGAIRLAIWPHAAVVPGAWMLMFVAVDALGARDLATPIWAALAVMGLFAAGFAVGRLVPISLRWRAPAAVLAVTVAAVLAPVAGAVLRAPWPAEASARLLDLSPATLLAESAGVDWLRHPAVYDAAGAVDIDPRSRSPYAPALAGGIAFVLGCTFAAAAEAFARFRSGRSAPTAA